MTRAEIIAAAICEWIRIDVDDEAGPGPFLIHDHGDEFNVDGYFEPKRLADFIEDRLQKAGFE